jgi:hypothetical protein
LADVVGKARQVVDPRVGEHDVVVGWGGDVRVTERERERERRREREREREEKCAFVRRRWCLESGKKSVVPGI